MPAMKNFPTLIEKALINIFFTFIISMPANARLVSENQLFRSIPFSLRDSDKPMIAVTIGEKKGVVMFDNGTPDAVFLNRDALSLPESKVISTGFTASGQFIEVKEHPAPLIKISGQKLPVTKSIRSGNFGFTSNSLGNDFLGFIGKKLIDKNAFILDFKRYQLLIFKTGRDGSILISSPRNSDISISIPFTTANDALPTVKGILGGSPILIDFDTGDSGTLYVTDNEREMLINKNILVNSGNRWKLQRFSIGEVTFQSTIINIIITGSVHDHRTINKNNQLRLGSNFLSRHPSIINFANQTLTILKPRNRFLEKLPISD
ncbi:hypothetical protein [Salinivibrio costicola]|uniref:Uncharacterized protein n=1 Tax=Salinivibrio costicola TaxID=51367 RepID=A0ABX6K4C7_SALCS|nr:hypothetical protein [Salinivibrio costicola]QIR06393.1 hypothetical protein HBA18_08390 [Salinivibrio costicola]